MKIENRNLKLLSLNEAERRNVMKHTFKKMISLCLSVVMFTNLINTSVTSESVSDESNFSDIEVFAPINEDSDFPLNMNIAVLKNSINYIELDEPIYGFSNALNGESLDFNVILSLKDNFEHFDSYEVKIFNYDYSVEFFSEVVSYDEDIVLSNLSVSETYKFSINLISFAVTNEYVGDFTIIIEINNSLVIDLFYQKSASRGLIMPLIAPNTETEPNSTEGQANTLQNGVSTKGKLYSTNGGVPDDYFKYTVTSGGTRLDVSISVPSGAKFFMRVYSGANPSNYSLVETPAGTSVQLRMNVTPGIYYIKLEPIVQSGNDYYLTASQVNGKTWYGQFDSTNSNNTVDYWNPNKLDTLDITWNGLSKKFFKNGNTTSTYWMKEGCGIAAAAMILRDKGKTMNGYDFRTNYSGYMIADPFTVMLANCNLNGTSMNVNSTSLTVTGEPIYFNRINVSSKFGMMSESILNPSKQQIKDWLDSYGSVMVYLTGSPNHFMVITGYNSSGSNFANSFYVYDPAARSYSAGAGVLLSNTQTGYQNKTYTDIYSIIAFY